MFQKSTVYDFRKFEIAHSLLPIAVLKKTDWLERYQWKLKVHLKDWKQFLNYRIKNYFHRIYCYYHQFKLHVT